jgi:hypothetical protein
MSRLEAHLQDRFTLNTPAQQAADMVLAHDAARAGSAPSAALRADIFRSGISPALSATNPPIAHHRSAPSAELWVQVTLCVVVTLLLLAVIAAPKRTDLVEIKTSGQAAHDLLATLQKLRASISEYRFDHGAWPGAPCAKLARRERDAKDAARLFEQQLLQSSDVTGETSSVPTADRPLGPYLDGHFPLNPIVGLSSVRILGETEPWPAAPDDATGWIYQPSTGEVRANCRGFVPVSALRFYDL